MAAIYITQFDRDRLEKLLRKRKPHDDFDKALIVELEKAKIVEPQDIPPNAITMNSHIRFVDEHGENLEYWVVFPEDADLATKKISILSPIGCALIGYKIGDKVTLLTPQGRRELTVKEIMSQPEREGRFNV